MPSSTSSLLGPIHLPTPLPPFALIHPTTTPWPPSSQRFNNNASEATKKLKINVLDSSFNPPHRAHYSLAALNPSSSSFDARLLIIGSSNADKGSMEEEDLRRRLEMMREMAIDLDRREGKEGKVGVAVVEGARFVEKSKVIRQWLGSERKIELTFTMGWDTLIRFFNPKYYSEGYQSSMSSFFNLDISSILCARRGDVSPEQEEQVLSSPDVKDYRDKVEMCDVEEEAYDVSSTEVRKAVKEERWEDAQRWVPVEGVREVIRREGMYKE